MKTNFYTYCILKYKHSPYLDESINIGVVIYFADSKRFLFKYSKTLNRVKSIYNNVPEKTIKEYIKQIDKYLHVYQSASDNIFPLNDLNFKTFLSRFILPNDSTVLQFAHFKTESLRGFTEDFIEKIVIDKVFIDDFKSQVNQPQEPKIISKLLTSLKHSGLNEYRYRTNRFQEDYILKNETGNEFKFDIAWQNGTLNLVKPIGFDLKEGIGIANKAHKNFGQFFDLQDEAVKNNLCYDLILGKPTNKSLFKDFDHAVKLLQNIKNSRLIDADDLHDYSKKVIAAISE